MKTVYRTSFYTKMIATLGILFALFLVGAFIYYCFAPQYADDRRSMVTLAGVITLVFIFMAIICILELKDTVVLTNKKIIIHLHRQSFPYSLKAIDDEVLWKDIRDAYFVDVDRNSTELNLILKSGEVKVFGVGHMDGRLREAIEDRFTPKVHIEEKEEEEEQEEDTNYVPGSPGTLEWFMKRAYRRLLVSAFAGIVGTALIALGKWPVLGFILVLNGLILGAIFLWGYHSFNASHINPALTKKGKLFVILGVLLLVCILLAAVYFTVQFRLSL